MIYKEYLKASERHLRVCQCMMSRCLDRDESVKYPDKTLKTRVKPKEKEEKFPSKQHKQKEKIFLGKHILPEIYYLSGHVIECIVNYGLYYILSYDKQKDVKDLPATKLVAGYTKNTISYENNIKSHNFQLNIGILRDYIKTNPNSDKFLFSDSVWKQTKKASAFKKWNVNVRYEEPDSSITEKEIKEFFELAEKIYTEIRNTLQNYK